jgi:hypothetical protein
VRRRLEEEGYITHTVDGRTDGYDARAGGSRRRRCRCRPAGEERDAIEAAHARLSMNLKTAVGTAVFRMKDLLS